MKDVGTLHTASMRKKHAGIHYEVKGLEIENIAI